jgi:hypothetical protein
MLRRDGYIYFALAPEVGRVKIGHTRDVPAFRIEELRTGCPVELVCERVIFGGVSLERALHTAFSDRRVFREWFLASVLDDVDAAVLEITGRRASPPRYPDLNPSRNPTPIHSLSGFQGLAENAPSSLKERPSRARSLSFSVEAVAAVANGRTGSSVGGNARIEETA